LYGGLPYYKENLVTSARLKLWPVLHLEYKYPMVCQRRKAKGKPPSWGNSSSKVPLQFLEPRLMAGGKTCLWTE